MIELDKLIDQLPYYFKEKDTYKDDNDQGILERFLVVLGKYLSDEVIAPLDNLTSTLLDIDTMDPKLLNFMWEFLGSPPYSHGVLLNSTLDIYGKVTYYEIIDNTNPRANFRTLLRYIMSIYKVRGSLSFYKILLRYYGYESAIWDPSGDTDRPASTISTGEYTPEYDVGLVHDNSVQYDTATVGNMCITVRLVIQVLHEVDQAFKDRIYLLLNKYRPVNIALFGNSNVRFTDQDPSVVGFDYVFNFNLS